MFRKMTAASLVVLSLAFVAKPEIQAGPINGPLHGHTRVEAYSSDWYDVTLRGGEPTTIVVIGDRDTDLDLYVYNQSSNRVAFDNGPTDRCVVTFVPPYTAKYRIQVKNLGNVFNRYSISVF